MGRSESPLASYSPLRCTHMFVVKERHWICGYRKHHLREVLILSALVYLVTAGRV